MWKQFVALARGRNHEAAEAVIDANALIVLRQQIRDGAATLERARLGLALGMAREREETRRGEALALRIADLEERAVAALDTDRNGLAREAAETIARLEADLGSSRRAAESFAAEIERLRALVADAETRLRDLTRGQRLAETADRVQRLRGAEPGESSLRDAEATLKRLRERQGEADAVARALDEMDRAADPDALIGRLAEAGCGAPVPHGAEAVLQRLQARRQSSRT